MYEIENLITLEKPGIKPRNYEERILGWKCQLCNFTNTDPDVCVGCKGLRADGGKSYVP
jgi:hypothetical protein